MDERRIERALRDGPPDEPAYQASISNAMGTAPATAYHGAIHRASVASRYGFAGLAAAALAIVVVALAVRPGAIEGPGASPSPDQLARIRSAGVVRVAVTSGHPQTTAAGGAVIGFDVDVAHEVALALGLRGEVRPETAGSIRTGIGDWALGLPSDSYLLDRAAVTDAAPYYAWPSWVVVPVDSPIASLDQIDGPLCIVTETAALDWLQDRLPAEDVAVAPPDDIPLVSLDLESACISAVVSGEADALVTAALLDDEFATRGLRSLSVEPVFVERRSVVVRGTGNDVATLVEATNRAVADLLGSGRMADLSRGAFGGRDLTVAP